MPGRILPLVTGEVYHVFNRGIDRRPTFTTSFEFQRAKETLKFYRIKNPPVKLSQFFSLSKERKEEISQILKKNQTLVKVFCFCLMPNHFHFLLKQEEDKGISLFLANFQNSYTRYFNTRHKRDGSLFLDQFKAVRIETDEQLIHVSRYIHLNPYTGFVVKSINELEKYPWSSLPDYLTKKDSDFIEEEMILNHFRSRNEYKKFLTDQADYQRKLEEIKHLIFE